MATLDYDTLNLDITRYKRQLYGELWIPEWLVLAITKQQSSLSITWRPSSAVKEITNRLTVSSLSLTRQICCTKSGKIVVMPPSTI